jgi:hypothetical protein
MPVFWGIYAICPRVFGIIFSGERNGRGRKASIFYKKSSFFIKSEIAYFRQTLALVL